MEGIKGVDASELDRTFSDVYFSRTNRDMRGDCKRLSVSCIYDAISGVRRYPMVSSNRNSSEVSNHHGNREQICSHILKPWNF